MNRIPVARALAHVLGAPVRIEAYDGSAAGPVDGTTEDTTGGVRQAVRRTSATT